MATLIAAATGNWATAGTWLVCDSTSESDSEASTVTVTTSNVDSGTFTPGAITVAGVALKLRSRPGTTGTFTVTLRNSTDATNVTSVTVNMSDFPASVTDSAGSAITGGWMYFKFGSSQLLTAGKAYLIRVVASNNSQLTLYGSTTTNTSRQLVTTTAPGAAPAAGDKIIICGEHTAAATSAAYTVTMNNTASTTYGTESLTQSVIVSDLGTLTFGTSSSTNYLMQIAGLFLIGAGGTVNVGTSGTPIPSTSTAIIDFVVTTNVASGIRVNGGVLNAYGSSRTVITTITSVANSGQAHVNVASVTGWNNNDELFITPTRRVFSQHEQKTISSISSLDVTLTGNLANTHDGSGTALAPNNARGHVGCLSHNVKIRGTDNTHRWFLYASTNASVTMQYAELKWLGAQGTTGKNGISIDPGVTTFSLTSCSIWNFGQILPQAATWNNITFSGCAIYNGDNTCINFSTASTNTNWTLTGNLICVSAGNSGIRLAGFGGTCTNNILAGHSIGLQLQGASASAIGSTPGTISGNEAYSNSTDGISMAGNVPYGLTVSTSVVWRNASSGFNVNGYNYDCQILTVTAFGNTTANFQNNATSAATFNLLLRALTANGETSFASANGLYFASNQIWSRIVAESCVFSNVTAHTGNDVAWSNIPGFELYMDAPTFGAATPIQSFSGVANNWQSPGAGSFIRIQKYNGTAGDHREYTVFGTKQTDTSIYHTASPSARLTPREASFKLRSASKIVGANSGQAVTASVYVYKSAIGDGAAYNGNQPRLIMRRNAAVGLASDVVLDTVSVAVGNWEQLTGATSTLSGDAGALEFYVDLDGTAGWVNVDDWTFSVA